MNFNEATDGLLAGGVTLNEIADALGVSYAAVKQARLAPDNTAHRRPPVGWQPKLIQLARQRGRSLEEFAHRLSIAYKAAYDEKAMGREWTDKDGVTWRVRTYGSVPAMGTSGAVPSAGVNMICFRAETGSDKEEEYPIENPGGETVDVMFDRRLQQLLDQARAKARVR